MKFRLVFIAVFFVAFAVKGQGQMQDSLMFRKISDEIMLHGQSYNNLRVLCKTVGHRISGSPEAAKAVVWGEKAMKATGADKVWLQACDVPYWYRGKESLMLQVGAKGGYKKVTALSLGNSQGTNGKVLEAPIVMVYSFDDFKALKDDQVKGKIIFLYKELNISYKKKNLYPGPKMEP